MHAWPALFAFASGPLMRRFFSCLSIAAVLLGLVAGCGGGDKDKGINSAKDRPKAADKAG